MDLLESGSLHQLVDADKLCSTHIATNALPLAALIVEAKGVLLSQARVVEIGRSFDVIMKVHQVCNWLRIERHSEIYRHVMRGSDTWASLHHANQAEI